VIRVDLVDHFGVVPAHEQRGEEGSEELGRDVGSDLAPGEALEQRQRDGHGRVEVGATDPSGGVDAERHAQPPGPGDAVVIADPARGHLRHDAGTEEDQNEGAEELGGQFTRQGGDSENAGRQFGTGAVGVGFGRFRSCSGHGFTFDP